MSRMTAKRFRSAEERAFPGRLGDDPVVNIASYNDKPLSWNKDTHNRYNCTPTNTSYRVLRRPGETCPLEAKLVDPGNPLCCASKVGANPTHQESLDFFKALKNIFFQVPAQHRILNNYPPNLRRLLQWVTSPTNASEVAFAFATNPIVLNTEHPRFLDLVKFAMMSRSHIDIQAAQPTGPPPNALLPMNPFFIGGNHPFLMLDDRIPLYDDLIRINNETGTTWQVAVENFTAPASVLPLPPIRANNFGYGGESPSFVVDFDDIVALYDTVDNNGWNGEWITVLHHTVVRPAVTLDQHFASLFTALARRNKRHLVFMLDVAPGAQDANGNPWPPVIAPPGYVHIAFQPGQLSQLVNTFMQSVNGFNFQEVVVDSDCRFDFVSLLPPYVTLNFIILKDDHNSLTIDIYGPGAYDEDDEDDEQ